MKSHKISNSYVQKPRNGEQLKSVRSGNDASGHSSVKQLDLRNYFVVLSITQPTDF